MDSHTDLLPHFTSFFQLAVAFNFSYAASDQLRKVIKKGFLYNIRNLADLYEDKKNELEAKLEVLADEDLNSDKKKEIKNKLTIKLGELREKDEALDAKIKHHQDITALKIQPIYIYTALIALFFLFLGGLEGLNNVFPRNEIFTIVLLSTIYILIFYYLVLKSSRPITSALSSTLALAFCTVAATIPIEIPTDDFFSTPEYTFSIYNTYINLPPYTFNIPFKSITDRNLLFSSLALSFFPFILASITLLTINFYLELLFRANYHVLMFEIKGLTSTLDNLSDSKKILNKFATSK